MQVISFTSLFHLVAPNTRFSKEPTFPSGMAFILSYLWACLALVITVIGSPVALESSSGGIEMPVVVGIIWYYDKATGSQAMWMTDSVGRQVYAASCSNTVTHDDLLQNQPLTLDVNANGMGRVIIGTTAYPITYEGPTSANRTRSDGPKYLSCQHFSDESIAQLDCLMLQYKQLERLMPLDQTPDCFEGGRLKFQELRKRGGDESSVAAQNPGFPGGGMGCGVDYNIERYESGNPVKKHLCKQVTVR